MQHLLSLIQFHLVDTNPDLVAEFKSRFGKYENFHYYTGDIFETTPDFEPESESVAIVSPANSFGYMDGGIDLAYSHFFGWDMQKFLQEEIINQKYGELCIGDALIVPIPTPKKGITHLICAPTMRVPMDVSNTTHAYLAFRATLIQLYEYNRKNLNTQILNVVCCGLATGIGNISYFRCAKQMSEAYQNFMNPVLPLESYTSLSLAISSEYVMTLDYDLNSDDE